MANQYLNNNYLRFVKKFGSYKKDRLQQPDYKPIVPRNNGRQSLYAASLDSLPSDTIKPRFISVKDDAQMVALAPLATLYKVDNPVDSLFRIDIKYYKGTRDDDHLDYAAAYVNELGTDSLTRTQLLRCMQQLGAIVEIDAESDALNISMTGRDEQFLASLQLLDHYLSHAKGDDKKLSELKRMQSLGVKSFGKDANTVGSALLKKLAFGNRSEHLNGPTLKETKLLTSAELLGSLAAARRSQCDVVYSGTLPMEDVASAVRQLLHLEQSVEPRLDNAPTYQPASGGVIYYYPIKDARLNLVGTYQQLAATPTWSEVADRRLFTKYFAGDMSSVLFQEIREFRSFAYSVGGTTSGPVLSTHPTDPTMLVTMANTQTDKTLLTIAVMDSVLSDIPIRPQLVDIARQSLSNELTHGYPNFREKGKRIATLRLNGYDFDSDAYLYEALQHKGADDVACYFQNNVKSAPRTLFVVGKLSKADLAALSKYGRIVTLEKRDLIKY